MEHNMLLWAQLLMPNSRINNILTILQNLKISPIELLMTTLGSQIQYNLYKDSFCHHKGLACTATCHAYQIFTSLESYSTLQLKQPW